MGNEIRKSFERMKYRVAQIIPYFGKWPEWMELYLYSCGKNPMVDFMFYTDCPVPEHRYENTIFHFCTYEEYCTLVSERLGIDCHCRKPYKLTDMKPFIGAIHEPELKDYDFWGMGDLDLVYGNLGMVVNDAMLQRYDVVTTHNYHIAGHCCFCRNNEYYRNLCFRIEDWREKITDEKPMSIDEGEWSDLACPGIRWVRRMHKCLCKPLGIHYFKVLDALNPILHRKVHLHEYWTSPQPKAGEIWTYDVKDNKMIDPWNRELPYLHFLFFKKTQWLETDLYWREGFYKLYSRIDEYKVINIDCLSISGVL